ncbi:MAG: hypothetical protein OEX23_01840 [Betaproteobacteria bacterium]|jgi:hypothetical protein|nr:hypothetical protein [Betaproteobacteria bacterium]
MKLRSRIATLAGAVALAAAAVHAPSASADRVSFAVSVGSPGFGVTVGNYAAPHASFHGGYYGAYYAPAPVVVAPPVPYFYRPYRPYYAPVVVPAPYPVVRPYAYGGAWGHRHHPYGHVVHVRGSHGHRQH